jgi:IS5 family transposase
MKNAYVKLLDITSRVAGQAKKFSSDIAEGVKAKQGNLSVMHKAKKQLDEMIPRVQQVMRQTRERVLRGNAKTEGKLLSVFETHTEVIRKGKANKPNEFGKLVLIQEAENQIITHYQVCEQRPGRLYLTGRMSEATHRTVRTRSEASNGGCRILFRR